MYGQEGHRDNPLQSESSFEAQKEKYKLFQTRATVSYQVIEETTNAKKKKKWFIDNLLLSNNNSH